MDKKLKAYVAREDDEGNCAIVYATNSATARRDGGSELNLSFEEVDSCRRAPEFDAYAPGPVPLHATLAAGWWHECSHCGVRFEQEGRHCYGDPGDDDDREDPFEPVRSAGSNYCSPTCVMKEWADRRDRKNRDQATIEATVTRWPEASQIASYQTSKPWPERGIETRASFCLPGLKHGVSWSPGASTVSVAQDDAEEFAQRYGINAPAQRAAQAAQGGEHAN